MSQQATNTALANAAAIETCGSPPALSFYELAARDMPDEPFYKQLERRGEEIYDEMYESGSSLGFLSEIKECFAAAIDAAEGEGLATEAQRLRARLDHIVAVYRSHFT